ncbi:MAG TPA: asparagine synthase-related protein, partial [Candidatus Sulfotelmatobacter sp.]|nr:asparagine synthase-related protein [Candidatus Sulfotelmatobacter sp.]
MTGICGLVGQGADDLEARANNMLSSMRIRGAKSRTFSRTLQSGKKITMGVCNVTDAQSLALQPVPLVLDGVFFGEDPITHKSGPAGPSRLIQTPGAFAFLTLVGDQLIAGRDIVGQKPLYFGETGDGVVAFASLRSPLVAIGIREPQAVPPGKLIRAAAGYYGTMSDYSLKQPEEEPIGESDATRTLNELFVEAVARTVPRGAGIAFSGGLDSALVAYAGKSAGLEPELICVGMKGQQELDHAERTAKDFGLPIDIWELSTSDVLNALPDVVSLIETTEPVIFGISVPLYLACQRAREMGLSFIAAGQLSDELFGGYGKFEEIALREGTGELGRAMFERVVGASAKDFDPGDKLAVAAGL